MKRINEMSVDQIIDQFIISRGLNPKNQKLRGEYSLELVSRAKRGDTQALAELLRIGTHTSKPIPIGS